jgi:hypothetical protein
MELAGLEQRDRGARLLLMKFWPDWAEREANNPPPGFDPRFWGYFRRSQGVQTVLMVLLLVGLLIVLVALLIDAAT